MATAWCLDSPSLLSFHILVLSFYFYHFYHSSPGWWLRHFMEHQDQPESFGSQPQRTWCVRSGWACVWEKVGGGGSCFVRFHLAQKSHLGHPPEQRHAYEATSLPWAGLGGGNFFRCEGESKCIYHGEIWIWMLIRWQQNISWLSFMACI